MQCLDHSDVFVFFFSLCYWHNRIVSMLFTVGYAECEPAKFHYHMFVMQIERFYVILSLALSPLSFASLNPVWIGNSGWQFVTPLSLARISSQHMVSFRWIEHIFVCFFSHSVVIHSISVQIFNNSKRDYFISISSNGRTNTKKTRTFFVTFFLLEI